jgi:hypothetical protein
MWLRHLMPHILLSGTKSSVIIRAVGRTLLRCGLK